MSGDLFSVLVDGVAATDEQVDAADERASSVDVKHILDAHATADEAVAEIARLGLVAALKGLNDQIAVVVDTVKAEGQALTKEDPRKVQAVTSLAVAQRRQERAQAAGKPTV